MRLVRQSKLYNASHWVVGGSIPIRLIVNTNKTLVSSLLAHSDRLYNRQVICLSMVLKDKISKTR